MTNNKKSINFPFLKYFLYTGIFLVASFFIFNFNAHKVEAAACNATTTGNWSVGSNWTGCTGVGGIPLSGTDSITINSGVVITGNTTSTVTGLTFATGAGANGLSINTGITVTVSGNVIYNANTNTVSQTLTLNGTGGMTVTGTFTMNTPTSTGSSLVTCATSATGTLSIGSTLAMTGNSTNTGAATVTGLTCTVSVGGLATITGGTNATGAATINSTTGTLTFSAGVTLAGTAAQAKLTTTGAGTINLTGTLSAGGTLAINSGTNFVTTGTSAINGAYSVGKLTVNSGTTTLGAGTITSSGALAVASGAVLSLGNFAFTASTTTSVTGTISVAGAGSTGTYTWTGAITVNSGGVFDLNTGTHAISVGGVAITQNSNAANSLRFGTGTFTPSATGMNFAGTGTGGINIGATTFTIASARNYTNNYTGGTLTFAGGTGISFSSPTTANSLTLNDNTTTVVSATIAFASNTTANPQTLTLGSGAGSMSLTANAVTMAAGTGAGNSLVTCAANNTGTFTVNTTIGITGNSTSTGKRSMGMDTCTLVSTGLTTLTGGSNATGVPEITSSTGTLTFSAGLTFAGTVANTKLTTTGAGVINFVGTMTGGGILSINSATDLRTTGTVALNTAATFGKCSVNGGTTTTGAILTCAGALAVANGATFTMGNFGFTASSTTTVGTGTSGIISTATGATGTRLFTGLVTVNAGGTFNLSGQNPVTEFRGGITHNGTTFNAGSGASSITTTASQSFLGASNMTFAGALTIGSGVTLTNSNTGTTTVTGILTHTGNWTQGTNSILSYGSATILGNSGAGTFDASTNTNTVTYTAAAPTCKNVTYDNLTFSGASGAITCAVTAPTGTVSETGGTTWATSLTSAGAITLSGTATMTMGAGLAVTNAVTISGGTLTTAGFALSASTLALSTGIITPTSSTITLSGTGSAFNRTGGTFTAGTSTIKFTNASSTGKTFAGNGGTYNNFWFAPGTGTGSLTVSGSNTFADFKADGTVAHSILFTTGSTQNIATFTVNGTAGQLISIDSTTTGTHALVSTGSNISVDYVSVQHSVASGTGTWTAGVNSVDNQSVATAGSGWIFTLPIVTLGDGTDGGNSTIGPGASATEIDRFSLVVSSGSSNQLSNSDFESGSGDDATSWIRSVNATRASDQAHGGTYSMKFTTPTSAQATTQTSVAVSSDTTYVLSGWFYNSMTAGYAYLDLNDISEECNIQSTIGNNAWQYVYCQFTTGPSTTQVSVRIVTDQNGSNSGSFWVDDVKLETVADTVTGMTVTLAPSGAYNNLATVEVYDMSDNLKCSSSSWGGDLTVELSSCGISVTTTAAPYYVAVTPKSHGSMPAVPGASYATTATVTAITATNSTAGTDTDSATITVDNASPGAVTSSTATPGNTVVDLAWTNPVDQLNNGLVGYWKLNEDPAIHNSTIADSSGSSNTGTFTTNDGSTNKSLTGQIGKAIDFDGVNDYVSIANESNFDFNYNNTFSTSLWVKADTVLDPIDDLFLCKVVSGGAGYCWYRNPDNTLGMVLKNSPSNQAGVVSVSSLPLQSWHHLVVTYDGSGVAAGIKQYMDGASLTLSTWQDNLSSMSILNNVNLIIGSWSGVNSEFLHGTVDDVRVWNRALSADEVATLYSFQADDYSQTVVLRRASSAVTDVPTEGSSYSVGNTIGSSTVACVSSSTSCQDTGLSNGTAYHYKIFTEDSRGNYNAGTVPSGSPATPVGGTTTLGDGTDGGNSTIAPGASATEIDRFSLVTASGTDTVTGMTVTLAPAGAFNNLATVGVYTTGDSLKCSSSSWGGDLTVELTSCAISVTTSSTEYIVKITPKTHANMPAVPGASYATTATVTAITATNTPAGTDTDSATITVDNLSPGEVTSATATPGSGLVDLAWTNPTTAAATYVRSNSVGGGTSLSLDIGNPGTNRLAMVIAGNESTGTNLTGASVDGKACNLVLRADNTNGLGNHQEMWYCDEDDLGSSNGSVTVAISGGSASWAVHTYLFTGASQGGPSDSGKDEASVGGTTITVTGIDAAANGLVIAGWEEGNGSFNISSQTSPLATTESADPTSADLWSSYGFETAVQTNKTYQVTLDQTLNRATGIVATWDPLSTGDFSLAVVLRRTTSAVTDVPVEGTSYSVGNTIGSSTVACVSGSTSCQDTGLTNGTAYYYKIFAKDSRGNYSVAGVVPTGSPATPVGGVTVSGNIYEPGTSVVWDGCDGSTTNVAISIAGAAKTNVACNASTGAFSLPYQNAVTNDIVTIFLDDGASAPLVDTGLVTRYYLDEASTGTAPTQALDSSGNGYDLTIDYGSSTLSYSDPSGGNRGLTSSVGAPDGTHNARHVVADSSDAVRTAMAGVTKATLEVALTNTDCPIPSGGADGVFGIGSQGDAGPFDLVCRNGGWFFTVNTNNGGNYYQTTLGTSSTKRVIYAVFDSTQATASDRLKIYENGTPVAVDDPAWAQNSTLSIGSGQGANNPALQMLNRGDSSHSDVFAGTLFYAAMYNDAFTQSDINNNVAVLLSNDDTPGGINTERGAVYTRAVDDTTNITGLSLAKNAVTLRYETGSSITNSNINTFDQSNDNDIPIASNGTNVTVDPGVELIIDTSKTYAPGGNVTTDLLHVKGTYTGGSETTALAKGLTVDSGGTFTAPTTLNLSGNLTNSGTFTHNSGTVNVTPGVAGGYGYSSAITIDAAQVTGSSNLTNFPVLFSGTYDGTGGEPDLRGPSVPGKVTNVNGYDIIFTSDLAGTKKLDFEIEKWNGATGEIEAWVKVPLLDYDDNTTIYMFYGNPAVITDQSDPTNVWTNGYAGVWHLKESSGTVYDSTSNSNNGTENGGVTYSATGKVGTGFDFDGSYDYVNIANSGSLQDIQEDDYSVSAWFNPDVTPPGAGTCSNYDASYGIFMKTGYHVGLEYGNCGVVDDHRFMMGHVLTGDVGATPYSTNQFSPGSWYYSAGTMSKTAGEVKIYVNGALEDTANFTPDTATREYGTQTWKIGTGGTPQAAYSFPANGKIDEVRISSTLRSPDWVATEYANQNAPGSFYTVGSEAASGTTSAIAGASNTTFNTFTVSSSNGAGKFLKFKAGGTYTFAGAFNVAGENGNILAVSSDSSGSQWTTTFNSTATASYISIKDSACSGGNNTNYSPTNVNLGNNGSCWKFLLISGGSGGVEASATPDPQQGNGGGSAGGGAGGSEGGGGGESQGGGAGGAGGGGGGDSGFLYGENNLASAGASGVGTNGILLLSLGLILSLGFVLR